MDKDIALVIAEMLIKQDETNEQIKELNSVVKEIVLNGKETNNTLREFIDVSVAEFKHLHVANAQQLDFNKQQQEFNNLFLNELKEIKVAVKTFAQIEDRIKILEERENNLEIRLANIEQLLKAS